MKPSRVTFVVHMLPRFNSDFGHLARALTEQGVSVTVRAPQAVPGATAWWQGEAAIGEAARALGDGVQLAPSYLRRDAGVVSLLAAMGRAVAAAWGDRDRVWVLWTVVPFVGWGIPLRLLGRPCVFLATGLGTLFGSDRLKYRLARLLVIPLYAWLFGGRRSRVILHNEEDATYLAGSLRVPRSNLMVTRGCGVDPVEHPLQPLPAPRERPVVLVPVRLIRDKGVLDAAAASGVLRQRGVAHEMWFSSSTDEGNPSSLTEADLERLRQENDWIRFLGHQPTIQPAFASCDVVLMPTRYREGLPTAILEAAAAGRAMVVTDNVGCRDFVVHGRNGLMVPPGQPEAMADALQALLTDPGERDRLRQAAHDLFLAEATKDMMVQRSMTVLRGLGVQVNAPTAATLAPAAGGAR